jgi:diguanylate cyclase (GGDEF)-like protein
MEAAEGILNFQICSIDLLEGDMLVPKAVSNKAKGKSLPFQKDEGIAGRTLKEGRTIAGDDVREFADAKPTMEGLRAFISVPIGELGVFAVASKTVGAFTQEDIRLAELLAGHIEEALRRVRLEEELRQQAIRDPLTGAYNRRYFTQIIEREVERSKRYGHPIGFLMIDVNRFKEINDRFGHQTGDTVLQEVANLLKAQVRDVDIVIRYGGDEFLIIFPEMDRGLEEVKGRIREAISAWNRGSDLLDFPLTLAMGAACWNPQEGYNVEDVLREADRKMYEDKNGLSLTLPKSAESR